MNKFSIICPFYNSEDFLKETISSVLKQSFHNWELILINDKSTDNGREICVKYSNADDRIRIIDNKKNEGPYNSRINGIRISTGDYILFLDSDDLLAPNALTELNSLIIKDCPDIVLFEYTRELEKLGTKLSYSHNIPCLVSNDMIMDFLFVKNVSLNLWTKCYKRKLFNKEYENNSIRYSEDALFLFNTALGANKMIITNQIFIYYRENNNSITHNLTYPEAKDAWNTYNHIYNKLFELKIFDGIFISENVIRNIFWTLFMVVWFTDNVKYANEYALIRDTFIYKRIENVKPPKINLLVNHILSRFIKRKDRQVDITKRIYYFFRGRK